MRDGRKWGVASAALVAAIAIGATAGATATVAPTKLVVNTTSQFRKFAGFSTRSANSLPRLTARFGAPTTIRRGANRCTVRWVGLGLTARIFTIGSVAGDPCVQGYVLGVSVTKKPWRSANGVHIGDPIAAARTACEARYTTADCAPVSGRYALQYQSTSCEFNPGRFVVVYATANAAGRVALIRANNLVCD